MIRFGDVVPKHSSDHYYQPIKHQKKDKILPLKHPYILDLTERRTIS